MVYLYILGMHYNFDWQYNSGALHCKNEMNRNFQSYPFLLVATGFPAGQTPLESRLQEVRMAAAEGATEIDIVINRTLALAGQWKGVL